MSQFRGRPEFEVEGVVRDLKSLTQPLNAAVRQAAASINRCSPSSKFTLICPIRDLVRDLADSALAVGLMPAWRKNH